MWKNCNTNIYLNKELRRQGSCKKTHLVLTSTEIGLKKAFSKCFSSISMHNWILLIIFLWIFWSCSQTSFIFFIIFFIIFFSLSFSFSQIYISNLMYRSLFMMIKFHFSITYLILRKRECSFFIDHFITKGILF